MAARNGSRDASQWPRGALRRKTANPTGHAVQSAPRSIALELHLHFAGSDIKDPLLTSWSSFKADHAMLWMAVATGIFLVWRGLGAGDSLHRAVHLRPKARLSRPPLPKLIGGRRCGNRNYLSHSTRDAILVTRLRRCDVSNAVRGLLSDAGLYSCASNSLRSSTNCASWRAVCSNIYEPRVALRRWERVGGGAARARDFIEARFINATRVIVTETADRNGEKLVLQFDPTPAQQMLVACLWSRTPIPGEPDLWFAFLQSLTSRRQKSQPPVMIAALFRSNRKTSIHGSIRICPIWLRNTPSSMTASGRTTNIGWRPDARAMPRSGRHRI